MNNSVIGEKKLSESEKKIFAYQAIFCIYIQNIVLYIQLTLIGYLFKGAVTRCNFSCNLQQIHMLKIKSQVAKRVLHVQQLANFVESCSKK